MLLVPQRQIFELEDSINAALLCVTDQGRDSGLALVLEGLRSASPLAAEEEARVEAMQEGVDEASDGVARFKGFANEAEYEFGKLKEDLAQAGDLLAEAAEAVGSVWMREEPATALEHVFRAGCCAVVWEGSRTQESNHCTFEQDIMPQSPAPSQS